MNYDCLLLSYSASLAYEKENELQPLTSKKIHLNETFDATIGVLGSYLDKHNISFDYVSAINSSNNIEKVIEKFINSQPYGKDFTRGLYYKGSI